MTTERETEVVKASELKKGDVLTNGFIVAEDARPINKMVVVVAGTRPRVRGITYPHLMKSETFRRYKR